MEICTSGTVGRMQFLGAWIGFLALAAMSLGASAQEKRVALVIANANYQNTSPLTNPINDAKAMATTLTKLGLLSNRLNRICPKARWFRR